MNQEKDELWISVIIFGPFDTVSDILAEIKKLGFEDTDNPCTMKKGDTTLEFFPIEEHSVVYPNVKSP